MFSQHLSINTPLPRNSPAAVAPSKKSRKPAPMNRRVSNVSQRVLPTRTSLDSDLKVSTPDYQRLAKKFRRNFWVQAKRWLLWRDEVSWTDKAHNLTFTLDIRGGVLIEAPDKVRYLINGNTTEHNRKILTWRDQLKNKKLPKQVVAKLPKGVHITEGQVQKELAIAFSHFMEGFDDHLTLPRSRSLPFAMTLRWTGEIFIHTDHRFAGGGEKDALDVIRAFGGKVQVWAELQSKQGDLYNRTIQEDSLTTHLGGSHILPASRVMTPERRSMLQPKLKGDLHDLSKAASFKQRLTWTNQMFKAVQQLLEQGVLHRDIKPANFLVDQAGNVNVADLGLAKKIDSPLPLQYPSTSTRITGTPGYLAPELDKVPRIYNEATELFALGRATLSIFVKEFRDFAQDGDSATTPTDQVKIDLLADLVIKLTGPANSRGTVQEAINTLDSIA